MLPDPNVLSLIPQQPPFVMISELVAVEGQRTSSKLSISADNVLVENGHFTEAGLVENIAQTVAARAGYQAKIENRPVEVGFITVVKNLEINTLPQVGQEILTEVEITDQVFNTTLITGRIQCEGQLIASCEMNILIQQPEKEEEA